MLSALVRKRLGAPRCPYVFPALVALLFIGHAYEDAGWWRGVALYAAIIFLSIVQALVPTVLGWLLLFVPFLLYGVVVAVQSDDGQLGEQLLFMIFGFGPAFVLWLLRPSRSRWIVPDPARVR